MQAASNLVSRMVRQARADDDPSQPTVPSAMEDQEQLTPMEVVWRRMIILTRMVWIQSAAGAFLTLFDDFRTRYAAQLRAEAYVPGVTPRKAAAPPPKAGRSLDE